MNLKGKERATRQNKSLKRKASHGPDRNLKKSKQIKEPDFLNSSKYQEKECGGKGNCLFLSISFLLGNTKSNSHSKLRERACNYMESNLNRFGNFFEYKYNPKEHIAQMRKLGKEGGHTEILALSQILKRSILVYEKRIINKKCLGFALKAQATFPKSKYSPLLIRHIPEVHYQAIIPKKNEEIIKEDEIIEPTNEEMMEVEEYFSFLEGNINPRDKQEYPFRKRNDDLYNDILKFYQSEQTYIPETLQQSGQAFRNKRSRFRSNCIDNYCYDTKLDRILAYEEVGSLPI